MTIRHFTVAILILCSAVHSKAQSRLMLGINAGPNVSRVFADTLANNFSRRNRAGFVGGVQASYFIKPAVSIDLGLNFVNKGYKVFNDTLNNGPSVVNKTNNLAIPLGVTFRQRFNSSNEFHLKAGFTGNLSMRKDSITIVNSETNPRFRITDIRANNIYPMFYLGFGMGGKTERGDRFEITVIYNQSFATDANLRVEYGQNYFRSFPLLYRGGFLQFGISYNFNLENFKKSEEYFID